MHIRQMHFDERDGHRRQCVTQGNTGMGLGSRVDDDETDALLTRRLHPVDQFAFVVALKALEPDPESAGAGFHRRVYGGQRRLPVYLGLTCPEQVQIRSVEHQYGAAQVFVVRPFIGFSLRHDRKFAANTRTLSS